MSRHVKGVSGSRPLDPVGGVKTVQVIVKMNAYEARRATVLAQLRKISRSELIRQLLEKELQASNEAFLAEYSAAKKKKRRARA
jgi:hypothetical protein